MKNVNHIHTAVMAVLIYILLGAVSEIQAQEPAIPAVGLRYHHSFIIQHTDKLKDEVTSVRPRILEAELAWHLRKEDVWRYCYCYPRAGFAFRFIHFDMPDVLGNSIAGYAFIEPFLMAEHRLNFSFRFGLGPAYLTKIYDEQNNPDNLFFGSPVSFIVVLNTMMNYRLTNQLMLRMAADYNHISNGGYAEPNLGMNFPSVSLGMDYSFRHNKFPEYQRSQEEEELNPNKNRFDFCYGLSFKPPSYEIREGLYPVHCLGFKYSRAVGRIFALAGGGEWINNRSLKALVEIKDLRDNSGEYLDHNRLGALAGMEWLFGRFVFSQSMGYYLYSPVEPSKPFYQRYGLNFRISNFFFCGINIKAHAQDADFIDVRMGVSL